MSSSISLLWQLTPPQAPASYLFGTMHVRDQRAFAGLDQIYATIDACPGFALEIDLSGDSQAADPNWLLLPNHTRLPDLIPPRSFHRLRAALLKAYQIDVAQFSRLKPIAIIELLTEQILREDNPLFLDAQLWEYASQQGKHTFGIETRAEQEALLQRIPMEVQIRMLLDIGRRVSHFRKQLDHMTTLYQKGDLKRLYHVSRNSAGHLRKWMLFDRNRIMAERIGPLIAQEACFIAIGAAHLWGGKGVLRLLRMQDIRIKPVPLH